MAAILLTVCEDARGVFLLGVEGGEEGVGPESILLCAVDDSGSGARVTSGRSAADFPLYFEAI